MKEVMNILLNDGLLLASISVALVLALSMWISSRLTNKKIPGAAIAIFLGLILAYVGGVASGGDRGIVCGVHHTGRKHAPRFHDCSNGHGGAVL